MKHICPICKEEIKELKDCIDHYDCFEKEPEGMGKSERLGEQLLQYYEMLETGQINNNQYEDKCSKQFKEYLQNHRKNYESFILLTSTQSPIVIDDDRRYKIPIKITRNVSDTGHKLKRELNNHYEKYGIKETNKRLLKILIDNRNKF